MNIYPNTARQRSFLNNFHLFLVLRIIVMPAGDAILEEEPYVHILLQKERGLRCDRCLEKGDNLKKCTACSFVRYCDRVCQKRDWTVHKQECLCLKNVLPKIPMDSVRFMLRLVIAKNLQLPQNSVWSRTFDDLMTHKAEILNDSTRSEQFAQMVFTLQQYAGNVVTLPNSEQLLDMFCKMTINSFTIWDGELHNIGTGIYLSASLLDHSCDPNAVVTFHGNTLVVRTTTCIKDPQPDKLRISYIEQLAPSWERQQQLREQYYFDCDCNRCQNKLLDDVMTGVQCPCQDCDGLVPVTADYVPLCCEKCETDQFSENFQATVRACFLSCKDTLEKIEEAKKRQDSRLILSLCKECLAMARGVLYKYNVQFVRLLDRGLDAAIDEQQWQLAQQLGLETLEPYRKLYPPNSPHVGIQLMKIGKLQLYLGELTAGLKSLREGQDILRITHGEKHDLYKELLSLINQCEEEMRMNLENGPDNDR